MEIVRREVWFSNGFGVRLTGVDSGVVLRRSFQTGRVCELLGNDFEKFGISIHVACAMISAALRDRGANLSDNWKMTTIARLSNPFTDGLLAFMDGVCREDNPYCHGSRERYEWFGGWDCAECKSTKSESPTPVVGES